MRHLLLLSLFLSLPLTLLGKTVRLSGGADLQKAIDNANSGDTILLASGNFMAKPSPFRDSLCGNCLNPLDGANASVGFVIKDKQLILRGADRAKTKLVTNAGYGLYIENASGSQISNLTITGGVRDLDGNATDGAIVVRGGTVTFEQLDLIDNTKRDTTVIVGIGGIMGREGASITARDCNIVNNTWDGVALYRGAFAHIEDCVIKTGRGAGVGVTWDASAVVYRTDVSGYWKGIGSFGVSQVIARNNFVHDNLGWGMIATGESYMDAANNVVRRNGNCGVAAWGTESRGRLINNIITDNGWRDQWVCPCVGVWNIGDWSKWTYRNNLVWNNKEGEYDGIWDQTDFNGNLKVDPKYLGDQSALVDSTSPTMHTGDSTLFNPDGTRSHIGQHGGPQAPRK